MFTFGPLMGPSGQVSPQQRMREIVEQAALADELGLDVYGVGEHHRPDFAVSAPTVVLAAIAERTKRIRLTSTVTVLSSEDPVRVFQQFSTLDLVSGGRAEIMVGRGSFIESFPLFGFDLEDYDDLFAEKLGLLLQLREGGPIGWKGRFRAPLEQVEVYPQPIQHPLPVWVAVGGNPGSAVRAGALGLPMAIAIIGGLPERFTTFAELHRKAAEEAGHDPIPPISINSHGYIARSPQEAIDDSFPAVSSAMNRIGRERGWHPMSRGDYVQAANLRGSDFVGTAEQIIDKIVFQHGLFEHDRFMIQFDVGVMPHDKVMAAIELLGTEVAPEVKTRLSGLTPPLPSQG